MQMDVVVFRSASCDESLSRVNRSQPREGGRANRPHTKNSVLGAGTRIPDLWQMVDIRNMPQRDGFHTYFFHLLVSKIFGGLRSVPRSSGGVE